MAATAEKNNSPEKSSTPVHRMRLPGFMPDDEVGLGDVIKRATSYLGIKFCGGCERRASALNNWAVFTRRGK